jgi:ATP-binding cassette subfamily B protein
VHAQLAEGITHLETLRCCAAEEQAKRRFDDASAVLQQRCWRLDRLNTAVAAAASAIFAASLAACLHVAADAVAANAMTVGGFVLATVYMLQMVRPLESLGYAARDLSRASGYLRPLLEVLAEPMSEELMGTAREASPGEPGHRRAPTLRLENLHFAYHPDRPVIRGLDLEVPAGSTTAIVGRSGSGKSSLARLLMRLHAPQQGRILLDGRAIETIDVAELRRDLIGLVPQETALLHETIAENIALGTPTASLDDIRMAARGAQLEELIDALPDGLGTRVGERGMQLSGGERQRVGIARALLRRAALYVLDEPTSMLDSRTEREIQNALRALPSDATTIVIAHRLSTIAHADEIVVLDEGRVCERGTHRALLAMNGLYARMWRQQMAGTG